MISSNLNFATYAPDLEIICIFFKCEEKKVSAGYQHKCIIIIIFREFNFLHNYYNYEDISLVEYKVVINDIYYE